MTLLRSGGVTRIASYDRLDDSDPDIKFTWTIDSRRINYLDIDAYKGPRFDETGRLDTRTHIKETHSFQYVHASSIHPPLSSRGLSSGRPRDSGEIRQVTQNSIEALQHLHGNLHRGAMDGRRYPGGPVPSYIERGSRSSGEPLRNLTTFPTSLPNTREQRRHHSERS